MASIKFIYAISHPSANSLLLGGSFPGGRFMASSFSESSAFSQIREARKRLLSPSAVFHLTPV